MPRRPVEDTTIEERKTRESCEEVGLINLHASFSFLQEIVRKQ